MRNFVNKSLWIFFAIVLKLLNTSQANASVISGHNIPVTTKAIEFELEVTDSISVDTVYLDFGNILKNSNDINTAQSYFYLNGSYADQMLVSTSYLGGVTEGEYTKFTMFQEGQTSGDSMDVHLHNISSRILSAGENRIPVVGEIREVGDISLGKYERTVIMDVTIQPVNP